MIVEVVQPLVNASEGTIAAVCVLARFPSLPTIYEEFDVNEELVTVNVSVVGQGSASKYNVCDSVWY